MRKAKEIAVDLMLFIVENNNEKAINKKVFDIVKEFVSDTEELIKSRNVKRDSALLGVLKETNQRWNAVAKICQYLLKDGFKTYMIHEMPYLADLWK